MTTTVIKASCHDCGGVQLGVRDLEVRVCARREGGSYAFQCPRCRMAVAKLVETRVVDMLVAAGVRLVEWRLPAELFEPRQGDPITHDDLIDFHQSLCDDAWFEALLATT